MAEDKMAQLKALRESRHKALSEPVRVPVIPKAMKPLPVEMKVKEYIGINVACPVCEARRKQTLLRVQRHRAKKISKKD